jgi:hypothetical protein
LAFYLSYNREQLKVQQRITAIAGTGQVDFHLEIGQTFQKEYPTAFGLLRKVMAPDQCSAATLLTLADYIQRWLRSIQRLAVLISNDWNNITGMPALLSSICMPEFSPENWIADGVKGLEVLNPADMNHLPSANVGSYALSTCHFQ